MTDIQASCGWYLMTQAERNAFGQTLVRLNILSPVEVMKLTAPDPWDGRRFDS